MRRLPRDNRKRIIKSPARQRRGAVAVLITCMLPVVLLFSVLTVGLNQMQLNRTELRVAADAAARAGARELSRTQSVAAAEAAAVEAASRNMVAGSPLILEVNANSGDGDIEFGIYDQATDAEIAAGGAPWVFTPFVEPAPGEDPGPINAVRVTGRKTTGSASGHVPLLFTPFLATNEYQPVITAGAMQIDRDIVLVVDRSGSMGENVDPNSIPEYVEWQPAIDVWTDAIQVASAPVMQQYDEDRQSMDDAYNAGEITQAQWVDQIVALGVQYQPWLDAAADSVAHLDPGPAPHVPTKWEALTEAVDTFLTTLEDTTPEEKVGLVWYDDQVGTAQPLTFDYDSIRTAMEWLGPRGEAGIGSGLQRGVTELNDGQTARPFAQKVVVVMTDGIHNVGVSPDVVAELVVQDNFLVIHGLTLGVDAHQSLMQTVADLGGGRFWHADDPQALTAAYEAVAQDIPTVLTE